MNCTWLFHLLTVLGGLLALAPTVNAQSSHADLLFWYEGDRIVVQTEGGMRVGTGRFNTSGLFRQFDSNPGFASEVDAGLGINPGDVIVYNVLGGLFYWDGLGFAPPDEATQIRIENNGPADPDTIVSGGSGPQPGSFSPATNSLAVADPDGDVHAHLDYFLEPNVAPDPPPPPALGAYGIKLSLSTSASGISDSAPFFLVFNFGLGTGDFADAVAAFSDLLQPILTGDYNQSGVVDAADYVLWRNTVDSTSNLAADGDGDGRIDDDDYHVWREHFGNRLAAGSSAPIDDFNRGPDAALFESPPPSPRSTIPEPTAVWLVNLVALTVGAQRVRRRSGCSCT